MALYTADNYNAAIATKGQLTAFRNADVKLASAECIAPDTFQSASITLPAPKTTRSGRLNKRIFSRYTTGYTDGKVISRHSLQTCQFGYWLKQGCSTTENTPAGYNTHALSLRTTSTPISFGYHFQSELASNNTYWDFLGIIPIRRSISCKEDDWTAKQELEFEFAYAQKSGDDINPTHRNEGATGTITKNWGHFVTGGLGANQTALTYNSGDTECHIIGFRIIEMNRGKLRARDASGFATVGTLFDYDYRVELDVVPDGDALFNLLDVAPEDYAGDLALDFYATADATNDKIRYQFNTLYLLPYTREVNFENWAEAYTVFLEPYDSDSTFTETGIDSLDNDNYENP